MGLPFCGLSRVPTGFLPIEDQGYLLVAVQLPDGAALARTQTGARPGLGDRAAKTERRSTSIAIAGISALDNSATLANAGVAYVVLKDWSERGDLRTIFAASVGSSALDAIDARRDRAAAAADPGHRQCRRLHHAGRTARRQHRFRQAAEHHQYDRRQRAVAERAAARLDLVPRRRAAIARRGRSRQGADAACHGRSGLFDARDLSRLELCRCSSTNSAASSRSMRRPMRSSGCGRATSRTCRCATSRAT